jgi:hypothetical protein
VPVREKEKVIGRAWRINIKTQRLGVKKIYGDTVFDSVRRTGGLNCKEMTGRPR